MSIVKRLALLVLLLTPWLPAQGGAGMAEANDAASVLVMERLAARNPVAWRLLRRCPAGAILLVDGRHDHTDRVLRALRLRHARCSPRDLRRRSLRGVRFLIIDCPGRIGRPDIARVREFVRRGGTLLTTDWAVLHVLQPAFGDWLRFNGRRTRDDVVRVSRVGRHRFTRGVFPRRRMAAWWLENESYAVRRASDVTVLFASSEMERRYGSALLGSTFRFGRGCVVHVVSHMYLQRNLHRHDWELRSARAEARGLDLPVGSPGYSRLERSGALGRIKAGDLNAALSVQQFLLNIAVYALERRPPPRPSPPRPPPPVTRWGTHEAARDASLFRSPGREPFLRISKGLRLTVLREGREWILVRTPAGQEGWLAGDRVRAVR